MQLNYNDGTTPQWNGNISNQYWGTPGSLGKSYTYGYDDMNRLTAGTGSTGNSETGISYDYLGNLQALTRGGISTGTLAYSYSGNQLSAVTNGGAGFRSYAYDANGNATTDGQGHTIIYNMLNLPSGISALGITYTYDAAGNKLRRVISGTATEYISGIQYTGSTIDFAQTEEGRVLNLGGTPNFEYTLSDHLGDTRVTFDSSHGGSVAQQVDDYYPFGMDINSVVSGTKNNYLYNKKELQDGLGQYDYGARFYDPVIARWTSVDPLAEKDHHGWTPYAYVYNNPILLIDPDGRDSTQRAHALSKAQDFVDKNPGNSYQLGAKGDTGEKVDCSGMACKVVIAGGEKDPNKGDSNGVTNIAKNTKAVDEKDVEPGNLVILDGKKHTGIITIVEHDKDGKIVNEQMIDSGGDPKSGKSGPRVSNLIRDGKKLYWGQRVDGYRKWDTKPDKKK